VMERHTFSSPLLPLHRLPSESRFSFRVVSGNDSQISRYFCSARTILTRGRCQSGISILIWVVKLERKFRRVLLLELKDALLPSSHF
jgi:hypothetical protein